MKMQVLMAITMLSLYVTLAVIPAKAQSEHYLVVNIPFEFAIKGKHFRPANTS